MKRITRTVKIGILREVNFHDSPDEASIITEASGEDCKLFTMSDIPFPLRIGDKLRITVSVVEAKP
tara:strand:- start:12198 stop:12395 length:198 start_codon:yes stop_codon:yes gene_type:complete